MAGEKGSLPCNLRADGGQRKNRLAAPISVAQSEKERARRSFDIIRNPRPPDQEFFPASSNAFPPILALRHKSSGGSQDSRSARERFYLFDAVRRLSEMNHEMAVGTNRDEVFYWIYFVLSPLFRNKYVVMDVNNSFRYFAVGLTKIEPAYRAKSDRNGQYNLNVRFYRAHIDSVQRDAMLLRKNPRKLESREATLSGKFQL